MNIVGVDCCVVCDRVKGTGSQPNLVFEIRGRIVIAKNDSLVPG